MNARGLAPGEHFPPILVFSPREADARIIESALTSSGLPVERPTDPARIFDDSTRIGCLIIAQEALTSELLLAVERAIEAQPAWSELPLVVLLSASSDIGSVNRTLERAWREAKVTLLARPVKSVELLSTVQIVLSGRLRQFRLRDQLAQEQELRRELNHRVKNILSTVEAMASMSQQGPPGDDDAFLNFRSRLAALAAVHSALHSTDDAIGFADLAAGVFSPYADDVYSRFEITGSSRLLKPEAAKTLGLCLHELATNAVKYGALSTPTGKISLSLADEGADPRLLWVERGGPPVSPPSRRGYGSRFIAYSLASIFGNTPVIEYRESGLWLEARGTSARLFESTDRG